jgi:hypothetical protein
MTTTTTTTRGTRAMPACERPRARARWRRMTTTTHARGDCARGCGLVRAFGRANDDADADADADEDGRMGKPRTLMIIECDGALIDVHGDGHRVAFNRAFAAKGVTSATWTHAEYASLLRSGGGTAYGMLERYFHFYGYPYEVTKHRGGGPEMTAEYMEAMKRLQAVVPLAVEDEGDDGQTGEAEARARREFLLNVIEEKDKQFQMMIDEGALKLRDGAARFIDDCLIDNDKVQVLLIAETASTSEERVLEAALNGLGPLRSAAVSITGTPESFSGGDDDVVSEARKQAARVVKKTKGDLLAPEVGGNLQRQNFNSDVIIDSGIFANSRRSMLSAEVFSTIAEQRGFDVKSVIFIGGSQTTCVEATSAGAYSVMVRNRLQRGGEFPGCDSVVDGYGAGEGITYRRVMAVAQSRDRA